VSESRHKNLLTTLLIIDIWNSVFKGGEVNKTAINSLGKGGDEAQVHTLKELF
jgi:hypothetical protein